MQHSCMTDKPDVPDPNLDETIPTNLSQPRSDSDPDVTIPMAAPDPDQTQPTGLNTDQMDTIGMAPTMTDGRFNDSDTNATQLSPQKVNGGQYGDNLMGQIWGDFEIGAKIGQGGMGAVYKGRQISLDRPVAIKVLPSNLSHDPSFRKRFELEAKAVAQIVSPYIIQVYGAGTSNGHSYFAMEFVEGKDLGERIKDGLRPTLEEAAGYILQAARGLAAAGEHNLIHRDIKPGNMMMTDKGQLKIMDFGLVKLKNEDGSSGGGLTMAGAVMGTVNYFSPEQGRGEECDQTTDIYALGIVFYQLLTGALPFNGTDATSIIYQHIHAEPRPLKEINPSIPESYQAIVSKCIQKDRRKRYQSANELIKDLQLTIDGARPQHAPLDDDTSSPSSVADKKGSSLGVIIILLLIIGGGAAYYFYDQEQRKKNLENQPNTQGHIQQSSGQQTNEDPKQVIVNGGSDPLTKAGDLIGRGELEAANILITQFLSQDPGNADWLQLSKRLREERAELAIKHARKALSVDDYEQAAQHLDQADELGGDKAIIEDLRDEVRSHSGLATKFAVIKSHLDAGLPLKAISELDAIGVGDAKSDAKMLKDYRRKAEKMKGELETAHKTLAGGDVDTARGLFQASNTDYPNAAARDGMEALAFATTMNRALEENQAALAEEQLSKMKVLIPDSPAVSAYEQRITLVKLFVSGKQAAKRGDLTAAQEIWQRFDKLSPDSARSKELAAYLNEKRVLTAFRAAITNKDLPGAQARMEELKKIAPESESVQIARREYESSKIEEEAERQRKAAFEQKVSNQVEAAKTLIQAANPDFAAINKSIVAVAELAGTDRPEIAELRQLEAARKADIQIRANLKAIDQAVRDGQNDELQRFVADEGFVTVLSSFIGKNELVFKHTVKRIQASSDAATVDAVLTNGYDVAPQNDISLTYKFKRQGDTWQIQSYKINQ